MKTEQLSSEFCDFIVKQRHTCFCFLRVFAFVSFANKKSNADQSENFLMFTFLFVCLQTHSLHAARRLDHDALQFTLEGLISICPLMDWNTM